MICKFKVKYYDGGLVDSHQCDSGFVAGHDMTDCFDKIRDYYCADDYSCIDSIEIKTVDWMDEDCNIYAAGSNPITKN